MENISVLRGRRKILSDLLSQISDITLSQFFAFILLFVFSRANFFGVLRPFSMALYVSLNLNPITKIISVFSITIGNTVFVGLYEGIRQLIVLVFIELLSYIVFVINSKKESIYLKAVIASGVVGISGIVIGLVQGLEIYYVVVALLSSLLIFALSIVFAPATACLGSKRSARVLDKKALIAKSVLLGITIISFAEVSVWGSQLATVLAGLSVIIIAGRKGSAIGALAGAGLGLIIALIDFPGTLQVPGMFALAGAAAGILTHRPRIRGILWIIATVVFSALSVFDGLLIVEYYEALTAGILFLILPNSVVNFLADELAGIKIERGHEYKDYGVTHEAADRLFVLGKSLMKVSRNMEQTLVEEENDNNTVAQWMIEAVAERVCSRCSMCNRCWNTYLFKTYKMVEDSVSDLKTDEKGEVQIPKWFSSICKNSDKFFDSLIMAHSIYKADKVWRQRLKESRMLLSQQSVAISTGIMNLARNMNNLSDRDTETEFRLLCAARSSEMPISSFRYHKGVNSKPYLEVIFEAKNKLNCDEIDQIVKDNIQHNYIRVGECRRDLMGYSVVKYMRKHRYKTVTGVARVSKDNKSISGDTFAFFIPSSGYHISAISDGMGSGRRAEKYSRTAIQILESLLDDGIDINLAVKFINIYLNMRGNENPLATMDICAIDLYNGDATFHKYDAPPTIIKKKHETVNIESGEVNDNFNILKKPHNKSIAMSSGDFLIMVSDGVQEAFLDQDNAISMQLFIEELDTINPQMMADMILNEAIARLGDKHDDMTVLVTKLW